jgi:rhodanese-related sulfurtransferase
LPPKINAEELHNKMNLGEEFILLDVRDPLDVERESLPGAVQMLITEMTDKNLEKLNKDLEIVTYSENQGCPASGIAAEKLEKAGFKAIDHPGALKIGKKVDIQRIRLNNPCEPQKKDPKSNSNYNIYY